MPERATISQGTQIGVESSYGTEVDANKKLQSLSLMLVPNLEFRTLRAAGYKAAASAVLTRQWTTIDLSGDGTYTEIVYPLSSVIDTATITTPSGATNARQWAFEMDVDAADAPKSFTVEMGDGSVAELATGVLVNDLTMNFSMTDGVTLSGSAFGQAMETGITMTSTPTALAYLPILGGDICVYFDEIVGDEANAAAVEALLGTTKLTRVLSASVTIGNRRNMLWAMDCALDSFAATVEVVPTLEVTLEVQADAAGMAFITRAQNATTGMLRIEAVSDTEIDAAVAESAYRFTFDAAVAVSAIGNRGDADGVLSLPVTFTIINQPTWTRAFRAQVVNALTAL